MKFPDWFIKLVMEVHLEMGVPILYTMRGAKKKPTYLIKVKDKRNIYRVTESSKAISLVNSIQVYSKNKWYFRNDFSDLEAFKKGYYEYPIP